MSVIDELRREGGVFQAYELAKEKLSKKPNQELLKKDMARILTELLQKNCFVAQSDEFLGYLKEFQELSIPKRDSVIHENIIWQVGKFIKELVRDEASSEIFDTLYDMLTEMSVPNGSDLLTFITRSVMESAEFNESYLKVLLSLRVRHLNEDNFVAINEGGEKKASPGETVLLLMAKALTKQAKPAEADLNILLEELDFVEEHYKNIPYTLYYKAKVHLSSGDLEKAEEAIFAYLKKRSKEYLAWELLADITRDKERVIQALCKTVINRSHSGQLLRSKIKLFHLFVAEKEYAVAKSLYVDINRMRRELNKGTTTEWDLLVTESWFKKARRDVSFENYCYKRSKPLVAEVFADWKAQNGIIYGINKAKDLAEFIVSDEVYGTFKWFDNKDAWVGDFVSLKLQRVANYEGVRYKVLSIEKTEKRPKRTIYKVVEDEIRFENDMYFVGAVSINDKFIDSKGYKVGDKVRIKAVKGPQYKSSDQVRWKILFIEKKEAN